MDFYEQRVELARYREALERIQHGCFNLRALTIKEIVDKALSGEPEFESFKTRVWIAWVDGDCIFKHSEDQPNDGENRWEHYATATVQRPKPPRPSWQDRLKPLHDLLENYQGQSGSDCIGIIKRVLAE